MITRISELNFPWKIAENEKGGGNEKAEITGSFVWKKKIGNRKKDNEGNDCGWDKTTERRLTANAAHGEINRADELNYQKFHFLLGVRSLLEQRQGCPLFFPSSVFSPFGPSFARTQPPRPLLFSRRTGAPSPRLLRREPAVKSDNSSIYFALR